MSILSKADLLEFRNSTNTIEKSLNESLGDFSRESKVNKVTIFLSHKHGEIEELESTINFLKEFGVDVYIDWLDEGMPKITSGKTAARIKEKIKENRKFIFLATEGAIASKWCNWELGYGDAQKYIQHIAFFPVKNNNQSYSGSEYMQIYPSIEYVYKNTIVYTNTSYYVLEGYYVVSPADENGHTRHTPLKDWLLK